MTDEEILYHYIDLSESDLTQREKDEVMDLVIAHKKAFSLRDEIGQCPDIKVNIEVNDPSTFFARPFPITEKDKPLMDKCMQKLVLYEYCPRTAQPIPPLLCWLLEKEVKGKGQL